MRNFIENFISFILNILIILVFLATVYFCLDVFGIIIVPAKYSIASLFYSQIEVIVAGENLTGNIVPENLAIDILEDDTPRRIEWPDEDTEETVAPDMDVNEALEILKQASQEQNNQNQDDSNENLEDVETIEINASRFYYDQLDSYGKIIYDELNKNIAQLKTGTHTVDFGLTFNTLLHQDNGTDILNNSFQLAINALTFDHPDLFYIDVTKIYLLTEITTRAFSKTYRVSIGGNGRSYLSDEFQSEELVRNAVYDIEQIKYDLADSDTENAIDKIKIVHDYLVDTIEYDSTAGQNIYNVYGALIDKRAVCEGYARSFKYVLDEIGIPCIIVCGMAKNRSGEAESHAWNYVEIDGKWYAVDATWDDPVIIGGGELRDENKYAYFLKGSNEFFKDHREDGNIVGDRDFEYPQISVLNYE